MNYVTLMLISDETLRCTCGQYLKNEHVYLIGYRENTIKTAYVRCGECFHKEMSEEKK